MTSDGLYWLFSSSAQTVASFSAFLLTGFALVLTILDGVQERDPTRAELHAALKRRHHTRLRQLSWATAAAILASLGLVAAQGFSLVLPLWLPVFVAFLNAAALIGGVFFAVSVTDPTRYEHAAQALLKHDYPLSASMPAEMEATEFIRVFIDLERLTRQLAISSGVLPANVSSRAGFLTLPQLINGLFHSKVIPEPLARQLAEIARYRNLVVHGDVAAVDRAMYERLVAATAALRALAGRGNESAT